MTVVRLDSPNNSHFQQYILLQARCEFEGCRAYLVDPAGHDTCRVHSFCAQRTADGTIAWHPEECEVCYHLWTSVSSDQVILKATINYKINYSFLCEYFKQFLVTLPLRHEDYSLHHFFNGAC